MFTTRIPNTIKNEAEGDNGTAVKSVQGFGKVIMAKGSTVAVTQSLNLC